MKYNLRSRLIKTGSMAQATLSCRYAAIHLVYLGFYTDRGRKFPHGNFRTSVFCSVKTQIVGKTSVLPTVPGAPSARLAMYIGGNNKK